MIFLTNAFSGHLKRKFILFLKTAPSCVVMYGKLNICKNIILKNLTATVHPSGKRTMSHIDER